MRPFIIADNQYITKTGVLTLLKEMGLASNSSEVDSRKNLIEKLKTAPNAIVIIDYTLFDFSDIRQMIILCESYKESTWLLFSDELSEYFLRQTLILAPSISVIMKGDTKQNLVDALKSVYNSETYICDIALQALNRRDNILPEIENLTHTEKLILQEIAKGKTTKEIAFNKNLSFHTINSHRRNIFRKLNVNNVQEAIKYAIRAGYIDLTEYYI